METQTNEQQLNNMNENEVKEEQDVVIDSYNQLYDRFDKVTNMIFTYKLHLNTLQQEIKLLKKTVKTEINAMKRLQNKMKPKPRSKKSPSGFARPTKVTKELCDFINIPEGSEIARTEVTKLLVNYIKENNLQEQTSERKNKIIPDTRLRNLLDLSNEEEQNLTFFNIQKYMNKHFISSKKNTITAMEIEDTESNYNRSC